MRKKIKAFTIAVGLLFGIFIVSFIAINFLMAIIVGTGNEVVVPDIEGMTFDVARKTFMDLNLYVQQVEARHDDEIGINRIISQTPEAGKTTKINRTVEVVVSKGPELVRVPYLDNITAREARIRLDNIGLVLGETAFRYSNDVDRDLIVYSEPLADNFVPRGSKVNVIVSLGQLPDASDRRGRYRDLLDDISD